MNPNDLTFGLDFTANDIVDLMEYLMKPSVRAELTDDAEYRLQEIIGYLQ